MNKIKACPFCGNATAPRFSTIKATNECNRFEECDDCTVLCIVCSFDKGGCGATSGYRADRQKTIDAWNRRESKPDCDSAIKTVEGLCNGYCYSDFDDEPIDACKICEKNVNFGYD